MLELCRKGVFGSGQEKKAPQLFSNGFNLNKLLFHVI
jgi:hypothetical protein